MKLTTGRTKVDQNTHGLASTSTRCADDLVVVVVVAVVIAAIVDCEVINELNDSGSY